MGKNKQHRKKHYPSQQTSSSKYTPKLSEEELCGLVEQCTEIYPMLSNRIKRLKEEK